MYALWELARRPEIQDRLREEATETYEASRARGDEDLTSEDIDKMTFTNAVVKVSQSPRLNSKNASSDGHIGGSKMSHPCY